MPCYEYECSACKNKWDVVKSMRDYDSAEFCGVCQRVGKRLISRTHFYGAGDWDKAQFCPGLGTVVRSNKERRRIAKARGLEEVGNEDLSKFQSQAERDRERKIDDSLEQAAKDAYQEIKS